MLVVCVRRTHCALFPMRGETPKTHRTLSPLLVLIVLGGVQIRFASSVLVRNAVETLFLFLPLCCSSDFGQRTHDTARLNRLSSLEQRTIWSGITTSEWKLAGLYTPSDPPPTIKKNNRNLAGHVRDPFPARIKVNIAQTQKLLNYQVKFSVYMWCSWRSLYLSLSWRLSWWSLLVLDLVRWWLLALMLILNFLAFKVWIGVASKPILNEVWGGWRGRYR